MTATFAWFLARADLAPMLDRQRLVALVLAGAVVVLVFELVRRRKLREEFSLVWMSIAAIVAALAWDQELLLTFSRWIGSSSSVSTLFFGAVLCLFALVLQFSVRLSRLTHRHRTLSQRLALLEAEVRDLREAAQKEPEQRSSPAGPVIEPPRIRDEIA